MLLSPLSGQLRPINKGFRSTPSGEDGSVAQRPIRLFGDPVLRTPCDAVGSFDEALITLVGDLEETVCAPGRAGLAANQIGVSRRAFAYHVDGHVGHLVNPVIEAIEGEQEDEEGCLSIPELWYPLRRARYARARGVDRLGRHIVVEGEGLLARCLQHEIDHLDGRLFVDRLSGSVRKQAMRDLRERFLR
jgi:peptide deformylase